MACAELLAVCLLSADRGPAPRRQPLPIFHDVTVIILPFDWNADDGKLSFEEFKNYFADGILSSEELWELFSGIDRRHSDNVDTEKLCGKWGESPASGGFLLAGSAMGLCAHLAWAALGSQCYESSSKMEQFLTRFLLRETMQQLQSLQGSLQCAADTVEEQAGRDRKDVRESEPSAGARPGRRCGRRGQKSVCVSPTDPYSGMLTTGTCSLGIPRAGLCPSGASSGSSSSGLWLGQAWSITPSSQLWLDLSCSLHSCPCSVAACKLTDEACFILYEFWQDVTSWRSHLQSSCSKTFQRSIISLLESPELLTTMLFPGEGAVWLAGEA
ncbi:NECA3 protein, partial [Urocolius indicus]|nr:NECA3 protein [Urocolius indicus]